MPQTTSSRRELLKRASAAVGVAALPVWLPRRSSAARPRITVWIITFLNPKADEIIQQQLSEFAAQVNADVHVAMVPDAQATSKLRAAVSEGSPPDVAMFFDTDYFTYRSAGLLLEISDLLDEMKRDPAELLRRAVEGVEEDGKAHGIPGMMNPSPIHWRKDLLERAGLDYPRSMFELVEVCKKIQEPPHLYGAGFCLSRAGDGVQNIQNILWLFGGWMTQDDRTPSIDSPGTVEGLRFIDRMYNADRIIPPAAIHWDATGNNEAYQTGKVAFICNPAAVYSTLSLQDPELMKNTGLSAFPPGPAGTYTMGGFRAYGVFTTTKEPNLAKDAMRWIMQPDRHAHLLEASGGRGVPVYRRLAQNRFWREHPVFNEFLKMPENAFLLGAKARPSRATSEIVNAHIIPDMVHEVLLKGVEPAQAAKDAQRKAQAIFDRHYKKQ
ncbi:MAG TPA: extracellular solute-binding protein [Burkholderiales bacterium]|nr:extracellular solute-binding protein [Burkholderiales bacterium]